MNKISICCVLVLTAFGVDAQKLKEADIPAAVKETFTKQFPNVKKAEWEKEGDNYEAEFKVSRVVMDDKNAKKENLEKSVVYSAAGVLLETEEEIKLSALPAVISEYLSKNYVGYTSEEASKITDNKGTVTYEVELEKGKEELDVVFDANGAFLKKETDAPGDKKD